MRTLMAAAAAALTLTAPAKAADVEQAAILGQVDRFFSAMAKQDVKALEELIFADGIMTIERVAPDGKVQHMRRPVRAWMDSIATTPGLEERIWSPTVLRRGPMAVVWAPYDIKLNGKLLHCGIDVFDMVKVDGRWRVASLMFTAEPAACEELKAPN